MSPLRGVPPIAAVVALLAPVPARAGGPEAEAQALHDRAVVMMDQHRYDVACRMFDEAAKQLPGALPAASAAAECYLRWERLATALQRYEAVEAQALATGQRARAADARGRIEALRARVSRVRVVVPPEVRALPGVQLRWGGARLGPERWDEPFPVDQGSYALEVIATGRRTLTSTIAIERDGVAYTIAVGVPAPLAPPTPPPLPPQEAAPPRAEGSAIPGIAALGVGAAGIGFGAMTGGLTLAAADRIKATCREGLCPPSQRVQGQRAETLATASTAGLVAGTALATAGVVLLVWKPFGRGKATSVRAGAGSVWVVGRF